MPCIEFCLGVIHLLGLFRDFRRQFGIKSSSHYLISPPNFHNMQAFLLELLKQVICPVYDPFLVLSDVKMNKIMSYILSSEKKN